MKINSSLGDLATSPFSVFVTFASFPLPAKKTSKLFSGHKDRKQSVFGPLNFCSLFILRILWRLSSLFALALLEISSLRTFTVNKMIDVSFMFLANSLYNRKSLFLCFLIGHLLTLINGLMNTERSWQPTTRERLDIYFAYPTL